MKRYLKLAIDPPSEERCGACPLVVAHVEQDFCGAFGVRLHFVHNDAGCYVRLAACRAAAIAEAA